HQQRPQRQVRGAAGAGHHAAVGGTDQLIVGHRALMGVEGPARLQHERVHSALRIGQLHPFPSGERAATRRHPVVSLSAAGSLPVPTYSPRNTRATSAVWSTPTTWSCRVTSYSPAVSARLAPTASTLPP